MVSIIIIRIVFGIEDISVLKINVEFILILFRVFKFCVVVFVNNLLCMIMNLLIKYIWRSIRIDKIVLIEIFLGLLLGLIVFIVMFLGIGCIMYI